MSSDLVASLWPVDRLAEAIEQLSRRSGYAARSCGSPPHDPAREPSRAWMNALAMRLGVELEPVVPRYRELPAFIARAAPGLLQVRCDARPFFLVLLGAGSRGIRVLAPDSSVHTLARTRVIRLLREERERSITAEVDTLLAGVEASSRARSRMRERLTLHRLGQRELRTCWLVRPTPTSGATTFLREAPALLVGILLNHLLLSAVLAGSFWVLGRAALEARLETQWFFGWIAVIACSIPLRLIEVWWQGSFSLRVGTLLKQQLLAGVLKLRPDEVRLDGIGRHFGRVAEAEAVELLALGGGLLALLSLLDLILAGVILQGGAGGVLQLAALALWTAFAFVLGYRHYAAQRAWSRARVDITHDLLERMLGHRTRLAQLPLEQWHDAEDQRLRDYSETSKVMDARTSHLTSLLTGGWLLLALLTLLPAFVTGSAEVSSLAISVGGILLALRAFDEIAVFFQQLSLAAASFEQIRELLHASVRPVATAKIPLELEVAASASAADAVVLEARGLSFRHAKRSRAVLENCSLSIARGDRILLEGPSGGGKSTLVALLTGLRTSEAGVLLLRGLDRATFGVSGWRRRVTAAPQFHENHVLTGSFAYNLLLGREWPVSAESRDEALAVCRELGLSELVAKMPSGLDELVGETGWQLSHGEKSRLYIARTLLQGGELVILDESFASLDPETMSLAVRCVLQRAPAVLVVSHP
ncbi:MAG TPA: ABC transporter ATP-binding protein [Polyangiales bacterium]|nr:ABC transporter ATP-binding protein [Polyangiales bacterium]